MYPPGFQTEVRVREVSRPLEGVSRGTAHFDGVATVVTKLFNIVQPTRAYFGQKDAQQVVVVQRMVQDLSMPVEIVVCPTVREDDGLALSSRNVRLDANSRKQAPAIKRALDAAAQLIAFGEHDASTVGAAAQRILADAGITPEYCDIVSPIDLQPVSTISDEVLIAIAARVGDVRLIDNVLVSPASAGR
jgi:pantoate--beta-alanine ligase